MVQACILLNTTALLAIVTDGLILSWSPPASKPPTPSTEPSSIFSTRLTWYIFLQSVVKCNIQFDPIGFFTIVCCIPKESSFSLDFIFRRIIIQICFESNLCFLIQILLRIINCMRSILWVIFTYLKKERETASEAFCFTYYSTMDKLRNRRLLEEISAHLVLT